MMHVNKIGDEKSKSSTQNLSHFGFWYSAGDFTVLYSY